MPLIQHRGAAYSAHQGPLIQWAAYRPQAARAMAAATGRGYQAEGLMCSLPFHMPSGIQSRELYLMISVGAGPLEMQLSEGQIVVQD